MRRKVQAVDKFVDELKKIQEEAKAALHKACDDMKCFADQMHMYRHIHNTIITCMRIIIPMIGLRVFGVVFGLYWAKINKEK